MSAEILQDLHVLYVEDEADVQSALASILRRKFKKVTLSHNGKEGLRAYKYQRPDVIITDIQMPHLSGLEMIRAIRKEDETIPIVITSALTEISMLQEAIALRVDNYITKPLELKPLFRTLDKIATTLNLAQQLENQKKKIECLQTLLDKTTLFTTSDLEGNITHVSSAFKKFTGYSSAELLGKNHSIFRVASTPNGLYQKLWQTIQDDQEFTAELQMCDKNQTLHWVRITINPIFNDTGEKIGYGSYRENITENKQLEYLSTHDYLTDTHNRSIFQEELRAKINAAQRYGWAFGIIMFDIDHFKDINDTYGHIVGDKVLIKLAHNIKENIRKDDCFARWGGEEFMVLANGSDDHTMVEFIHKIQKMIHNTDFTPVPKVTFSFGVTQFQKGDDEKSILKRVDKALYTAKKNGRNSYEIL